MKKIVDVLRKVVLSVLIALLATTNLPTMVFAETEEPVSENTQTVEEVVEEKTEELVNEQSTFDNVTNEEEDTEELLIENNETPTPTMVGAVKVKVEFDTNGGQETLNSQEIKWGSKATKPSPNPTRYGYTFKYWSLSKTIPAEFDFNTTIIAKIKLYAIWEANTYAVAFDSNGGSGSMSDQSFTYDEDAKALTTNTYTKTGYTFKGWNTAADGNGTSYTDGQSVKNLATSGTVTLYAQWDNNSYTIVFNNNNGTGSMDSQIVSLGVDTNLTTNAFTRDYYDFNGWNTAADGNGTSYTDGQSVKNLAGKGGTITLYAQWKGKEYNITYNLDGGSLDGSQPTKYVYGVGLASLPTPTKGGYTFEYWYTKGDKLWSQKEELSSISASTHGDIEITAQWDANDYTVYYDGNGGEKISIAYVVEYNFSGQNSIQARSNAFKRDGYTFTGWNTSKDGTGTSVAVGDYIDYTWYDDDVYSFTLYAQWQANTYNIYYNNLNGADNSSNPTTYNATESVTINAPSRENFEFIGWSDGENNLGTTVTFSYETGDKTYTAIWKGTIPYTINFDDNSEYGEATNKGMYTQSTTAYQEWELNEIVAPTKNGYVFRGYYDSNGTEYYKLGKNDGDILYNDNGQPRALASRAWDKASGATLKAEYDVINYDITLDYNYKLLNQEITETLSGVYNIESAYALPTVTTIINARLTSGYKFAGWYTDAACTDGNEVTSIAKGNYGNKTYYAKWVQNYELTVSSDNGTVTVNGTEYTGKVEIFTDDEVKLVATANDGYDFASWSINGKDGILPFIKISTDSEYSFDMPAGNVTATANYNEHEYTITYSNLNGATNDNKETYTISSEFTLSSPTRDGYVFDCWTLNNKDGAKVTSIKGSDYLNGLTLYANWKDATQYTATFVANGGKWSDSTTANKTIDSYTVNDKITAPATVSKDYYEFAGWKVTSTNGNWGSETYTDGNLANSTGKYGDVTFTAQWEPVKYTITYVLNSGTNSSSNPENYTVEQAVTLANPSREYYTFDGWYTESSFTNKVTGITLGSHENKTFYAKWTPKNYTITLSAGLHTFTNTYTTSISVNYGEKIIPGEDFVLPERDGYVCTGYYLFSSTTQYIGVDDEGKAITTNKVLDKDVFVLGTPTLYAHWVKANYSITYVTNGGTINGTYQDKYEYGTGYTLPTDVTKTGYTFAGWKNLLGETVTEISDSDFGNKTVYASWTANTYYVEFYKNDGTDTKTTQSFTYDDNATALKKNTYSRDGYVFVGWNTKADRTGTSYEDEEEVKNLTSEQNGTYALYAQWNRPIHYYLKDIDVSNDDNPTSYRVGVGVASFANPTRIGYNFLGWYDGDGNDANKITSISASADEEIYLYAHWQAKEYTVTLNSGIAGNAANMYGITSLTVTYDMSTVNVNNATITTDSYNRITVPTWNGYVFEGYYTLTGVQYINKDGGSARNYNIAGDVTLYAHWIKGAYSIEYETNGGQFATTPVSQYTFNTETVTLPTNISKTGYTFMGWYTATGVKTTAIYKDDYGNKKYFALWAPNTYTVSFVDEDGTSSIGQSSVTATYDLPIPLTNVTIPTKAGYTFDGYVDENGKEYINSTCTISSTWDKTEDTTLKAKWKANTYKIYYMYNYQFNWIPFETAEFTYGEKNQSGEYKKALISSTPTAPAGYEFDGWYSSATGGSKVEYIYTLTSDNITIYPHWKAKEIALTLDLNYEGGGTISTTVVYDLKTGLSAQCIPSRTGYTFEGYYDAKENGTKYFDASGDAEFVWNVAEPTTLYAHWSANKYTVTYYYNYAYNLLPYKVVSYHYDDKNTAGKYELALESYPDRDGYTADGWYTSATGGSKVEVINTQTVGDQTLYPHWTANTYTVEFYGNGGSGSMNNQSFTYDAEQNLTSNAFVKANYDFKGWNTKQDGTGTSYTDGQAVKNLTKENSATVKLYAQWEPTQYTITYVLNNGKFNTLSSEVVYSYDVEDEAFVLEQPLRYGYTFTGWTSASISTPTKQVTINPGLGDNDDHKNLTFNANWEANVLEVTLDMNGGSYLVDGESEYDDVIIKATYDSAMPNVDKDGNNIPAPTRAGYEFVGYYSCTDLLNIYIKKYINPNLTSANNWDIDDDTTLYAKFDEFEYKVKYDINYAGGNSNMLADDNLLSTQNFIIPASTYTRIGYKFVGWSTMTDSEAEGAINFEVTGNKPAEFNLKYNDELTAIALANNKTITLYAIWEPYPYSVKYNENKSSIPAFNGVTNQETTVDYEVDDGEEKFAKDTFVIDGYHIVGYEVNNYKINGSVVNESLKPYSYYFDNENYTADDLKANLSLALNDVVDVKTLWRPNAAKVVDGVAFTQYKSEEPVLSEDELYEVYTINLGDKITYTDETKTDSNYHNQTINAYLVGSTVAIEGISYVVNVDSTITVKVPVASITKSIEFRIKIAAKDIDKDDDDNDVAGDVGLTDNSEANEISEETINDIKQEYAGTNVDVQKVEEIIDEINDNISKAKVENTADNLRNDKLLEIASVDEDAEDEEYKYWYKGAAEDHDENEYVKSDEDANLVVVVNVDISYDVKFENEDNNTVLKQMTFTLDPYALVYSNGEPVHKKVDGEWTDKFDVTNEDLGAGNEGVRFLVTLPTNGVVPKELVHKSDDPDYSTPEYYYEGDIEAGNYFAYDPDTQTISLYIKHFSTIQINDHITRTAASSTVNYENKYEWSKDYKTCKATRYVAGTETVVLEESVVSYITVVDTTDAKKGYVTYTATFANDVFETQNVSFALDGTNYPTIEYQKGNTDIDGEVSLLNGGIYSYIKLVVNDIEYDIDKLDIAEKVNDVKDVHPFEMHLENTSGKVVESKEGNKYGIELVIPDTLKGGDNYVVAKIGDEQKVTLIDTEYDAKEGTVNFVAEEMGNYVIVSTKAIEDAVIEEEDKHTHTLAVGVLIAMIALAVLAIKSDSTTVKAVCSGASLIGLIFLAVKAACAYCWATVVCGVATLALSAYALIKGFKK